MINFDYGINDLIINSRSLIGGNDLVEKIVTTLEIGLTVPPLDLLHRR